MFTIIRDTRERTGWEFHPEGQCEGCIDSKLSAGDYSIKNFEDVFTIERKSTTTEFAKNITEKRFWKTIDLLAEYELPFIVCEFSYEAIQDYPYNLKLPYWKKNKIRVNGSFMISCIKKIQYEYDIPFLLCDRRDLAQQYSYRLINDIWLKHLN